MVGVYLDFIAAEFPGFFHVLKCKVSHCFKVAMATVINNGVPLVNGMLTAWADIVVLVGGVPVTGIIGVEYSDEQEAKP